MRSVKWPLWISCAGMLLVIPLPWIAASLAAALVHEAGHLIATLMLGGRIEDIQFHPGGAVIYGGPMESWKGILCSMAGPMAGAALLLLYPMVPRIALCAFAQTVYNLLPVEPLDGGRALGQLQICLTGKKIPALDVFLTGLVLALIVAGAIRIRSPGGIICACPILWEKYLANRQKKGYNSVA